MVVKKQEFFDESKHRWVDDDEIIIEDLSESEIFEVAEIFSAKGYNCEYWKAPKQESGHLHIRDLVFPRDPELSADQKRFYKKKLLVKYVPSKYWSRLDWNFITTKRHRIAREHQEHFKGYGMKSLVREWNDGNKNYAEEDVFKEVIMHSSSRKLIQELKSVPREKDILNLMTYLDFENLEEEKEWIVEGVLKPKTLNMVFSPPASFKSLIALSMGLCISQGREWLGFETKKQAVLYLDKENSDLLIKERLQDLYKGFGFSRKNFPFFVLRNGLFMDAKRRVNVPFLSELERVIDEKGIKVLFIDTLHRVAHYDENRADDINLLYEEILRPLIERFGLCIVFLHHTTKKGTYRGSGDFEGMVDVSYSVTRKGKTNLFTIKNDKGRSGEREDIHGQIVFDEGIKKVMEVSKAIGENSSKVSELKRVTEKIKSLFEGSGESKNLRKIDIISQFDLEGFECSDSTVKRSLKFLTETQQFLDKKKGGVYSRILR